MVSIHIDNFGDLAIVECEGRIVSSDAAFALRNAVTSQTNAHIVILDLSELEAIGGGGVGVLLFAAMGPCSRFRLKLFNPSVPCAGGWTRPLQFRHSSLPLSMS